MIYSYTQISHYLTCPRRYRHRYLDGWMEKDTRAAVLFGRAFESALGALFRREDPAEAFLPPLVRLQNKGPALFQKRYLGHHALPRHHVADSLLPGRPHPDRPAKTQSANQAHTPA